MNTKTYDIEDLGTVVFTKRRRARYLRLSVDNEGRARVSMPTWVSYRRGLMFLMTKKEWLKQHRPSSPQAFEHGMSVGKEHRISFAACADVRPTANVKNATITIKYPLHLNTNSQEVQSAAKNGVLKALKHEAMELLPARLAQHSLRTGLKYKKLVFRQMKRRWGSCSSDGQICLNIFLMQLPWHLIDYVLLHELTHTKIMNHGVDFWAEFSSHLPASKQLRKEMRRFHPSLATAQV